MTREINVPKETWTLLTISSCSFQTDSTMQVAESASMPVDWTDPKNVVVKTKIYEYAATDGYGLWGLSAEDSIITINDGSNISESAAGFLRAVTNPCGGIDVNVQDQTTPIVIAKFHRVDTVTDLAVATAIDEKTITLTDSTGFVEGEYIIVYSDVTDRYYLGSILDITGNVVTVDSPLDSALPVGATVTTGPSNMAVDGSITPSIFGLRGENVLPDGVDLTFDMTRIIFHCTTSGTVDLSKFADIAGGITNGLVLRKRDGVYNNIFNVKTNGEISGILYDLSIQQSTNPAQGQNGFYARLTFASQGKLGVAVRLEKGEDLEFIVQDDLSSIELLEVYAEGHIVD